jgi:hypothetical protein
MADDHKPHPHFNEETQNNESNFAKDVWMLTHVLMENYSTEALAEVNIDERESSNEMTDYFIQGLNFIRNGEPGHLPQNEKIGKLKSLKGVEWPPHAVKKPP